MFRRGRSSRRLRSLLDRVLGRPLAVWEEGGEKIGAAAGIAVLGLDGLSSAAYGPEAALTILIPLGALGLACVGPLTGCILVLLALLYISYRQTLSAYPSGGGSYTVSRENLGTWPGLAAAAALMIDYVLNVAVGISAGVGALVSAVPPLHDHVLGLCLGILLLLMIVNLRGVRESSFALGLPTVLFVGTLAVVLVMGTIRVVQAGGHPAPIVAPPPFGPALAPISVWILLRAFAAGCTAMTGVEAVSNGVPAFAPPAVRRAEASLTGIVSILAVLLAGLAFLAHAYRIGATDPTSPSYQSIISQIAGAVVGRGLFYYVTLGSVLAVLSLSANTSFADFPRLCKMVALDGFLPHAFAQLGRRLVYSVGVVLLTVLAGALLVVFGGITDRLIPLFAVGAFLAFTFSQAGMVVHWRRRFLEERSSTDTRVTRRSARHARVALVINAAGCLATAVALVIILIAKLAEGAWITVVALGLLLWLFAAIKSHYEFVDAAVRREGPLEVRDLRPPVVVVPLREWNRITHKAMRFALKLSPDVIAVHVQFEEGTTPYGPWITDCWEDFVVAPVVAAGGHPPRLEILESPYRRITEPLLEFLRKTEGEYPDRQIAVVIPELVEAHWTQFLLHNQRAQALKAALLFHGGRRVVVVNVPWYLDSARHVPEPPASGP